MENSSWGTKVGKTLPVRVTSTSMVLVLSVCLMCICLQALNETSWTKQSDAISSVEERADSQTVARKPVCVSLIVSVTTPLIKLNNSTWDDERERDTLKKEQSNSTEWCRGEKGYLGCQMKHPHSLIPTSRSVALESQSTETKQFCHQPCPNRTSGKLVWLFQEKDNKAIYS